LYRRLGELQGQSGWVQKISPPLGFNPWSAQTIASHYPDYAITWDERREFHLVWLSAVQR
jgi:hypothetical protein